MTTQRSNAASSELATLVLSAAGEQIARAVWDLYGDQISQTARNIADEVRVASGAAARRCGEEMRAHGADFLQEFAAKAKTSFGEACRSVGEELWDAVVGRALAGGQGVG